MNVLVIMLFLAVFLTGYLGQQLQVLPRYAVLSAELLTAIALLAIVGRLIAGKRLMLDWRYGVFIALFFFVLAMGFATQYTALGTIVAGLRNYVKYLPFFLLPAIYPFTRRQIAVQVGFLIAILLAQVPLAVYQRFVQFGDRLHTGDPVRGMATTSSALSLLMVCGVALVVSLYLRRKVGFTTMLLAIGAFVVPTMLNETKGTLVLLPVALLGPAFFMPRGARAFRRLLPIAVVGSLALGAYAAAYNTLIQHRGHGQPLAGFFTAGHVEEYLYTGAADGERTWIGRFDSIAFALRGISGDPLTTAFGLSAGNVSVSQLPGFDGRYSAYVELYGADTTQVSAFLWEIGFVGLACYLLLYWCLFQDARVLASTRGPAALDGQVWGTVVVIMTMALMYKSVFAMNEIAYLFWFYSGVVARETYEVRRKARARRTAPVPRSSLAADYRHQPGATA